MKGSLAGISLAGTRRPRSFKRRLAAAPLGRHRSSPAPTRLVWCPPRCPAPGDAPARGVIGAALLLAFAAAPERSKTLDDFEEIKAWSAAPSPGWSSSSRPARANTAAPCGSISISSGRAGWAAARRDGLDRSARELRARLRPARRGARQRSRDQVDRFLRRERLVGGPARFLPPPREWQTMPS